MNDPEIDKIINVICSKAVPSSVDVFDSQVVRWHKNRRFKFNKCASCKGLTNTRNKLCSTCRPLMLQAGKKVAAIVAENKAGALQDYYNEKYLEEGQMYIIIVCWHVLFESDTISLFMFAAKNKYYNSLNDLLSIYHLSTHARMFPGLRKEVNNLIIKPVGNSVISHVAQEGNIKILEYIRKYFGIANLNLGWNKDEQTSLIHLVVKYNQFECFKWLVKNNVCNYQGASDHIICICMQYDKYEWLLAVVDIDDHEDAPNAVPTSIGIKCLGQRYEALVHSSLGFDASYQLPHWGSPWVDDDDDFAFERLIWMIKFLIRNNNVKKTTTTTINFVKVMRRFVHVINFGNVKLVRDKGERKWQWCFELLQPLIAKFGVEVIPFELVLEYNVVDFMQQFINFFGDKVCLTEWSVTRSPDIRHIRLGAANGFLDICLNRGDCFMAQCFIQNTIKCKKITTSDELANCPEIITLNTKVNDILSQMPAKQKSSPKHKALAKYFNYLMNTVFESHNYNWFMAAIKQLTHEIFNIAMEIEKLINSMTFQSIEDARARTTETITSKLWQLASGLNEYEKKFLFEFWNNDNDLSIIELAVSHTLYFKHNVNIVRSILTIHPGYVLAESVWDKIGGKLVKMFRIDESIFKLLWTEHNIQILSQNILELVIRFDLPNILQQILLDFMNMQNIDSIDTLDGDFMSFLGQLLEGNYNNDRDEKRIRKVKKNCCLQLLHALIDDGYKRNNFEFFSLLLTIQVSKKDQQPQSQQQVSPAQAPEWQRTEKTNTVSREFRSVSGQTELMKAIASNDDSSVAKIIKGSLDADDVVYTFDDNNFNALQYCAYYNQPKMFCALMLYLLKCEKVKNWDTLKESGKFDLKTFENLLEIAKEHENKEMIQLIKQIKNQSFERENYLELIVVLEPNVLKSEKVRVKLKQGRKRILSQRTTQNKVVSLRIGRSGQGKNDNKGSIAALRASRKKKNKGDEKEDDQDSEGRIVGDWYLGNTVGKGGFAWVKVGFNVNNGEIVALKFMKKDKENKSAVLQAVNEIDAIQGISHKNIIDLYAYNLNAKYPTKDGNEIDVILLVLEYAEGGELFDLLYYTHALEEVVARTYFHQIIAGLEMCHKSHVIHRDLKPENLLLDGKFNVKIADFGLCELYESSKQLRGRVGTPGYRAPEVLSGKEYGAQCDVFSVGVILFHLLNGYAPFDNATKEDANYSLIMEGKFDQFWNVKHKNCPISDNSSAKNLVQEMLAFDEKKRITISQIKKHEWYDNICLGDKLYDAIKSRYVTMAEKRKNDDKKTARLKYSMRKSMADFGALNTTHKQRRKAKKENGNKLNKLSIVSSLPSAISAVSSFHQNTKYEISDPLVVVLGVSDSNSDDDITRKAMRKDYKNMIQVFSHYFGYSMFYRVNVNKNEYSNHKGNVMQFKKQFKLKWNSKEISTFVNDCKNIIVNKKHDSLIFIMSCYGSKHNIIFDSNSAPFELISLFCQFDSKHCPYLADKPKLFFVNNYNNRDGSSSSSSGSTGGMTMTRSSIFSPVSCIGGPDRIDDPLVAMIGVGEYDSLPNLDGVKKDYENVIKTFTKYWGYNVFYQVKNNQFIYSNNLNQISLNEKKQYKLKWNGDEIDEFVETARKHVVKNKHSGLIFIISSHGDREKMMYDSEGEQYELDAIFSMYCPMASGMVSHQETEDESNYLSKIPKIFLLDMCRGDASAKPIKIGNTTKKKKNNINIGTYTASEKNMEQQPEVKVDVPEITDAVKGNNQYNSKDSENKDDTSVVTAATTTNTDNINSTPDDTDEKEKFQLKGISKESNKTVATQYSNFAKVYATTEGYAVSEGSSNGGIFLRNCCRVFKDKEFVSKNTFHEIVLKIREYTKRDATIMSNLLSFTQLPEEENTLENNIQFIAKVTSTGSKQNELYAINENSHDNDEKKEENNYNSINYIGIKKDSVNLKIKDNVATDKANFLHKLVNQSELYHKDANFCYLYTIGDNKMKHGKKGGYLIQAMKKVFCKKEIFKENKNLDQIISQIKMKARNLVMQGDTDWGTGKKAKPNVEDINHCNLDITFCKANHHMNEMELKQSETANQE